MALEKENPVNLRSNRRYAEALADLIGSLSREEIEVAVFPGDSAIKLAEEVIGRVTLQDIYLPRFVKIPHLVNRRMYNGPLEKRVQIIRDLVPEREGVAVVDDISAYGGKIRGLRESFIAAGIPIRFIILASQYQIDIPDVTVIRPSDSYLVHYLRFRY